MPETAINTEIETISKGKIVDSTITVIEVCGAIPAGIANKLFVAGYIEPYSARLSEIPSDHPYNGGWIKKTTRANAAEELKFLRGLGIDL